MANIRVLVVDDSPTVQAMFQNGLNRAAGIEVIGVAPDPYVARDMIVKDPPDVLTLDLEMPRMDGLTFLRKLMQHFPMPVVIISSHTKDGSSKAQDALAAGAVEVVAKDQAGVDLDEFMLEVVRKVRSAAAARVQSRSIGNHRSPKVAKPEPLASPGRTENRLLAIGSSTGGTEALARIFCKLPADSPPTLVVQHMPPGFTRQLAERLDRLSAMEIREARDGDRLNPGLALIAPGDRHLLLQKHGNGYQVRLKDGPRVGHHKPSVNVMFTTMARLAGEMTTAVILTGMGHDGAQGMLSLKEAGAHTIAQDEASCVVFGMPREAIELGGACEVVSLDQIPERILASCTSCRV